MDRCALTCISWGKRTPYILNATRDGLASSTNKRAVPVIRIRKTLPGPMMSLTPASVPVLAGLTEQQAQARLTAEGYNELPRHDRRTPLRIAARADE